MKIFGAQSNINDFPFKDLDEIIVDNEQMKIELKEGSILVHAVDENTLQSAKALAELHVAAWGMRNNVKLQITFSQHWKSQSQSVKTIFLKFEDKVEITDRIKVSTNQVNIEGKSRIIKNDMYDSASLMNDEELVLKARIYPALKSAMMYYNNEVLGSDEPLYGVYKVIESMTKYLDIPDKDGRKKLANLIGQSKAYIDEITQTTQFTRHHVTGANINIGMEECIRRTKVLFYAFAKSLA